MKCSQNKSSLSYPGREEIHFTIMHRNAWEIMEKGRGVSGALDEAGDQISPITESDVLLGKTPRSPQKSFGTDLEYPSMGTHSNFAGSS